MFLSVPQMKMCRQRTSVHWPPSHAVRLLHDWTIRNLAKFIGQTVIRRKGVKGSKPCTGVTVNEVAVPDVCVPLDWADLVSAAVRSLFAFDSLAVKGIDDQSTSLTYHLRNTCPCSSPRRRQL